MKNKYIMSRPVYTVLYSLLIIGLFFSLSIIYQSCGNNKKQEPDTESIASKVEDVADSYTEDAFFEDDENKDDSESSSEEEDSESIPVVSNNNKSGQSESYTASSTIAPGGFVVIAGNYLLEGNADTMVKKLKSAGYVNAQKVVFDLSQYYTVVAGRYDSRTSANGASSDLKTKGIDNYVLRRN